MALIGTIRKQSGLLIVIIGLALAAFVLGDFLKKRPQRSQQFIAEVYGEEIPWSQFNAKYETNLEIQKRNQKKEQFTQDELFNIRQQTWDQMIQEIVLAKEYDELGVVVSAEELFDQLQGDNPHAYIKQYFKDPQTQQYDPQLVRNYMKQLDGMDPTSKNQWNVFVGAIKQERIKSKYQNLITKAYFMPDTFIVKDFIDRKKTAEIRLVGVQYNTINDSTVTVTENDYKKFYDKYKQNYEQEASKDIDYVVFDVKPSAKDRAAIRKEVDAIYADFQKAENVPLFVSAESDNKYDSTLHKPGELPARIDSIMFNSPVGTFYPPYQENNSWHMAKLVDVQMRPDSMKASHILISYAGNPYAGKDVTRIKVAAKALADSLEQVIKASPQKLEALAKQFSDDPSVKENSGDMNWFADGAMVYPFNQAVLDAKVGDITFCESQFGYHIIKVTGKKEPTKKVRVAMVDREITPSKETNQEVYAKASLFQGKATTLEAFDTLATSMGLYKRVAQYIQPMGNRIAGIDNPRQIVKWAYIEGIGVGSVSHVFSMEDKYVVAMVTVVREKGIPPFEELKERVEPLVKKELKGDMMVEKFKAAAKDSKNLAQIAQKLDTKVDTVPNITFAMRSIPRFGNEGNVLGKVFAMKTGVISKPVKGNNAAFFMIVDKTHEPNMSEDKKISKTQLLRSFTSSVSNGQYIKALEKKAEIVDNRVTFY
ncbi:MAG: hypothetical protein GXO89_08435 [Chlorobi bacterium]|nr:hypothetical protein [Chlorobiota bacterium]